MDLHVESACALRDRAADAPHAVDPQTFSAEMGADQHGRIPAFPLTATHQTISFGTTACGCKQAQHGDVGGGVSEHVRSIAYGDAARFGGVDVNVFITH